MEGITISEVQLLNSCFNLEKENKELRELLRWRRWPEEKPEIHGWYITTSGDFFGLNYYHLTEGWQNKQVVWWKSIGPLPGGE